MKKLVLSFLCVLGAACLFAAQWGASSDYDQKVLSGQGQAGDGYLLRQILEGRPVKTYLHLEGAGDKARYQKIISDAYAQWFAEPARFIRQSGREDEFADVLPLLERGIEVQFVGAMQERDVEILILPFAQMQKICGRSAGGCYIREQKNRSPLIIIPKDNFIRKFVTGGQISAKHLGLHEIGHSLGLSDQYQQARAKNSHPIYSTEETMNSVMSSGKTVTCDDADGIINLIDITRGGSRGGAAGWSSLCKGSDVRYVNGAPLEKSAYAIVTLDEGKRWQLDEYRQGRKVAHSVWVLEEGPLSALAEVEETVMRWDYLGRPERARGSNGEDIYYSYIYGRITKLTVAGGRALRAEISDVAYKKTRKGEDIQNTVRFFVQNGKVAVLMSGGPLKKNQGKEGFVLYQEGMSGGEPSLSILINFDAEGKEINRSVMPEKAAEKYPVRQSVLKDADACHGALSASVGNGVAEGFEKYLRREIFNARIEEIKSWYLRQRR